MERVILHSDLNNCYASIECLRRPELRGKPVAVGGDEKQRKGIVLAKNEIAKSCGVKTGETLWTARAKCPQLQVVPPDFSLYVKFCKAVRELYYQYTDQIEPFGLDEAWLDVTGSRRLFGTGEEIAQSIRRRVKEEMGVTVSVGVSFNKVFAKLGSDMKKPDAVTVITSEDYREKVWPLPVDNLLFVGRAGGKKLRRHGIDTIGDLARSDLRTLELWFGKNGALLHRFANGQDNSRVMKMGQQHPVKSISNGSTAPRDLVNRYEVRMMFLALAESVAERLREGGFLAGGVQIEVKDSDFKCIQRQTTLICPTNISGELTDIAMELFCANYDFEKPVRALSLRTYNLREEGEWIQTGLMRDQIAAERMERLERTVDSLRSRYGRRCVMRAAFLCDPEIGALDPKAQHIIFPEGRF
ncbi:MAG: DNA polymerase IV [Oscillospiraceae bacterium]|nr:DNA polymerase IV [Oscillospiraceae bacterium]